MNFRKYFTKIFRYSIILFFIIFTISTFDINSYLLGHNNICSQEKNDINQKCEYDCFCDRGELVHAENLRIFTLGKAQINKYQIFLTKPKSIEEKANSPPII